MAAASNARSTALLPAPQQPARGARLTRAATAHMAGLQMPLKAVNAFQKVIDVTAVGGRLKNSYGNKPKSRQRKI